MISARYLTKPFSVSAASRLLSEFFPNLKVINIFIRIVQGVFVCLFNAFLE